MKHSLITGLDIGNHRIKMVTIKDNGDDVSEIVNAESVISRGMNKGTLVKKTDAVNAIKSLVRKVKNKSGIKVKDIYLAIGGIHLDSYIMTHSEKLDEPAYFNEQTFSKIEQKIIKKIEKEKINRKVVYIKPTKYLVDGSETTNAPLNLRIKEINIEFFIVTSFEQYLNDIYDIVTESGLLVQGHIPTPIATANSMLNQIQKSGGCVLVNIGSHTLSVVLYEDGHEIGVKVFPMGGLSLTKDIASHLKIHPQEAEKIKINNLEEESLKTVINHRMKKIFLFIDSYIKESGKNIKDFPFGLIISGGSGSLLSIEDIAKLTLNLHTEIGATSNEVPKKFNQSLWSSAFGTALYGLEKEKNFSVSLSSFFSTLKNNILSFLKATKQYIPK